MKINILKKHGKYDVGHTEVDKGRGEYLVKMGVADYIPEREFITGEKKEYVKPATGIQGVNPFDHMLDDNVAHAKKKGGRPRKEKIETKGDNVPTAKKKKI